MKRFFLFLFFKSVCFATQPEVSVVPATEVQKAIGLAEYVFNFENFPKNEDIQLSYSRLLKKDPKAFRPVEMIRFNEDGSIRINNKLTTPYMGISAAGFAKGEEVRYRLESNDKLLAETKYVPRPIFIQSDEGSFSMNVVLAYIAPFTTYYFYFNNLAENEALKFRSISGEEVIDQTYNHKGAQLFAYSPGVIGKEGGESAVRFTRSSGDQISFNLNWGKAIIDEALTTATN